MTKQHMKRLSAPKTWPILRKVSRFIIRPVPSGHARKHSLPLTVILRDVFDYAQTAKESRKVIRGTDVLVDAKKAIDGRQAVGIMDTLHLPLAKKAYRVSISRKGKLVVLEIPEAEASTKVCKVIGKRIVPGGKVQLNLHDGRNILAGKTEAAVGDSLVLALPKQDISSHIKLDKGTIVFMLDGGHTGRLGTVEQVKAGKVTVSIGQDTFETVKEFMIAVGKDKPLITVMKDGQ